MIEHRKRILLAAGLFALGTGTTAAQPVPPVNAPIIAEIDSLALDAGCNDNWCGGTLVVAGQTVVLPRNLLIDLPANRLSLKQIFDQAPAACKALRQSGLARTDTCLGGAKGAFASLSANTNACGQTIAGDIFIQKGPETLTGLVTFINYNDGYFRIGGQRGSDTAGTMVRMNDPGARNSIQQGKGCPSTGGQNCSPDPRFTNDPDNYTLSFLNGYPLCVPSTVTNATTRLVGARSDGSGDPLCPSTNRGASPVPDSTRFAPMLPGDHVTAIGGFEVVGDVRFLSAHTVTLNLGLTTANTPTQPDFIQITEAVWDLADFPTRRVRARFLGNGTLPDSQLDIFALRVDPNDGSNHEDAVTSTVGNPITTNLALGGPGGIWRMFLDVDFRMGAPVDPRLSPCTFLRNAGFNKCPNGQTLAEEFAVLQPVSREIIGRTRHKQQNPGLVVLDIKGNPSRWGEYLRPLGANLGGLAFPAALEFNLGAFAAPFVFDGMPWALDRRNSPTGCALNEAGSASCESTGQPLLPFPASGTDPRGLINLVPPATAERVLTFFNFVGGLLLPGILPWPPADACTAPPPSSPSSAPGDIPPIATADTGVTAAATPVTINVVFNDRDPDGTIVPSSVAIVTPPVNGTVRNNLDGTVTYTPNANFAGTESFTYNVRDNSGSLSNTATVSVTVADRLAITLAQFRRSPRQWQVSGTSNKTAPNTVTIFIGATVGGRVLGTANVDAQGNWVFDRANSPVPAATRVSVQSSAGGKLENAAVTIR